MAPVAVEPRKINPPGTKTASTTPEVEAPPVVSEEPGDDDGKKKRLPIIPILAGLVAVIVLGLLIKVLKAK